MHPGEHDVPAALQPGEDFTDNIIFVSVALCVRENNIHLCTEQESNLLGWTVDTQRSSGSQDTMQ